MSNLLAARPLSHRSMVLAAVVATILAFAAIGLAQAGHEEVTAKGIAPDFYPSTSSTQVFEEALTTNVIKTTAAITEDLDSAGECQQLGYNYGYKKDDPSQENFTTADGLHLDYTFDNLTPGAGMTAEWSSSLPFYGAVLMKSGTGYNVYNYAGETDDQNVETPHANQVNGGTNQAAISHITFCWNHALTVEKTVETSFTRTHNWDVAKAARDAAVFVGEDVIYEIDVAYVDYTDTLHHVDATIVVTNPWSGDTATDVVVIDSLGAVDCGAFGGALAPGATVTCSSSSDGQTASNTATASAAGWASVSETAAHEFDIPTTVVDESVTATDGPDSATFSQPVGGSFTATRNYGSEGAQVNTVCLDTVVENCDSATVNVYGISVAKVAAGTYGLQHDWSIAKIVDDSAIFEGESVTWTVVVTYDDAIRIDGKVNGAITVTNSHLSEAATVNVVDAALGINQSLIVPANSSADVVLTDIDNGTVDFLNEVSATNSVGGQVAEDTINVAFANNVADDVDGVVDVTDNGGSLGTVSVYNSALPRTFSYSEILLADKTNVATVVETALTDDGDVAENTASATVNVYGISVEKTAGTSYDTTWVWDVSKTATKLDAFGNVVTADTVAINEGGSATVEYAITVGVVDVDSNWNVSGSITITNNHPDEPITVNVSDAFAGFNATLSASSVTVLGGGQETVSYSISTDAAIDGINTATVTSPYGVSYEADAPVAFGAANITNINPQATLVDIVDLGPQSLLGGFDALGGFTGTTVSYSTTFTDSGIGCSEYDVVNTAVVSAGTQSVSNGHVIAISELCPQAGQGTLTQGYWKTHSEAHGPAAHPNATWDIDLDGDETTLNSDQWLVVGGENAGVTWYEMFELAPQGNPYIILAHQWMAATLNGLNDACVADGVADSLAAGEALLSDYAGDWQGDRFGKGKKNADLAMMIEIAGFLDEYNNGLLAGCPHADND